MARADRRWSVGWVAGMVACAGACGMSPYPGRIVPDVVYGHKFGLALTFDVFQPAGEANGAAVLYMVSGGWMSRWTPPERLVERFTFLLDEGFTVLAVRHGSSPKFTIPEIVQDVRQATRYARRHAQDYGVDPDRIGVYGSSAGGHLALMLGVTADDGDPHAADEVSRTSDRVAAVVAYYPPVDLRGLVSDGSEGELSGPAAMYPALRFDPDLADVYSPLSHVTPEDSPTLLAHGDQDRLVPLLQSERIHAAFQKEGVATELMVIKGARHGFRGADQDRVERATVEWFKKHLLPAPDASPAPSKTPPVDAASPADRNPNF